MSVKDDSHPDVRFSMLQLDINDNGLPQEDDSKPARASRTRSVILVTVGVIVVLATIAVAVGITITAEAKRVIRGGQSEIYKSSVILQSSSSTLSSSLSTLSSSPLLSSSLPFSSSSSSHHVIILTSTESFLSSSITTVLPSSSVMLPSTSSSSMTSSSVSPSASLSITPPIVEWSSASSTSAISTTPSMPACNVQQFRCASGQCVVRKSVCNRSIDCLDQSDELFCSDCERSGGFQCGQGLCLWDGRRRCNGVFDCSDLSDELHCPLRSNYLLCDNGIQIPQNLRCNGVDDCDDNSDEINCRCHSGRVSCPDGQCIMRQWLCDGYPDCTNGTDEQDCNKCSTSDFACQDYHCVNASQVCDGVFDCQNGQDERQCVHLQGSTTSSLSPLSVQLMSDRYPVCSDGWTNAHSFFVCQELSQSLKSTSFQIQPKEPPNSNPSTFLVLKQGAEFSRNRPITTYFINRSTCPSKMTVTLSCRLQECGERKASIITPFIAGGNISPEGKWPWVVSLSYLGETRCAGALIDRQWVITAGHCVIRPGQFDLSKFPSRLDMLLGTVDRVYNISHTAVRIPVSQVVPHPNLTATVSGILNLDVALVKLTTAVPLSDFIQPICLPYPGQLLHTSAVCFLAGWGLVNNVQYITPRRLRDAKMQVWSDVRCKSNTVGSESSVDTNSTLCAGYLTGLPTGCRGDSGGPLMCRDSPGGNWVLAGIMSSGSNQCQNAPSVRANRFTRTAGIQDWIQSVIYD